MIVDVVVEVDEYFRVLDWCHVFLVWYVLWEVLFVAL